MTKSKIRVIDVAREFTRYPAGRFKDDGPYSGQRFREEFLVPVLDSGEKISLRLDGTAGYGSSFLEEAFGGLVRAGYDKEKVLTAFTIDTRDPSLLNEIQDYIKNAVH